MILIRMGQGDIARILEEHYPKWMCFHDIKEFININEVSIRRSLKALEKRHEVEMKIIRIEKYRGRQLSYYRINKNG